MLKIVCILSLLLAINACSSFRFPWAHQVVVQQGNYVESDMVDSLKVGMTRRQVKFVMGSPLVEDTFSPDRWEYYYTVSRGNREFTRKHFTVYFEGDKLARWETDSKEPESTAKASSAAEEEKSKQDIAPEDDEEYMDKGTTEE